MKLQERKISKGTRCSSCRLPWETRFKIRSAYLVKDHYVCQNCYQNAKFGNWDMRAEHLRRKKGVKNMA